MAIIKTPIHPINAKHEINQPDIRIITQSAEITVIQLAKSILIAS